MRIDRAVDLILLEVNTPDLIEDDSFSNTVADLLRQLESALQMIKRAIIHPKFVIGRTELAQRIRKTRLRVQCFVNGKHSTIELDRLLPLTAVPVVGGETPQRDGFAAQIAGQALQIQCAEKCLESPRG